MSAIIQRGAYAIEVLAMVLVPGGIAVATADWPYRVLVGRRPRLARPLHLGREILIAADIVWTVALQAAHLAGAELAILVLIRTSVSRQRTRKKEKV